MLALKEIAGGLVTSAVLAEVDLPVVKPESSALAGIDPMLDF